MFLKLRTKLKMTLITQSYAMEGIYYDSGYTYVAGTKARDKSKKRL